MRSRAAGASLVFALALISGCSNPGVPGQPPDGLDASSMADAGSAADVGPAVDGPRIAITPLRLDFDSSTPMSPRRFAIANVGTAPLKIGKVDGSGAWIVVAPELAGDAPEAFGVEWPPAGLDEQAGIAPGAVLDVVVRTSVAEGGQASALLRVPSNDPESAEVQLTLRAEPVHVPQIPCTFDVVPPRISFGSLELGRTLSTKLTIRNVSSNPDAVCVVGSVAMETGSDPAFSIPNPPAPGTTIPADGLLEFEVRFASEGNGPAKGAVVVRMANAAEPATVQVGGEALPTGCLLVSPKDYEFFPVQVGCSSREVTVTVYNVCPIAQQIDAITLSPANAGFRLTRSAAVPHVLAPQDRMALGVTFRPSAVGESSATLQIGAAGGAKGADVELAARAFTKPIQTDVFGQGEQRRIDVLLVVDNSVSMASRQQRIASEVRTVMDVYDGICVDYQIAVTTTEVDAAHGGSGTLPDAANGRFLPLNGSSPRVVTSAMPDRHQLIDQRLQLGFASTAPEYLIRPAVLALTPPLSTAENAGFNRPGAQLVTLLISDSADHDTAPVAGYASTLQALKPYANLVSFSAVIPTQVSPPATCSYGEPGAGSSSRVRDMVQATGGVSKEICDGTWLSWGGWHSCADIQRTRFYLSQVPADPHAIEVTVNGVRLPETAASGQANWRFDGTRNTLDLAAPGVLPPGATMVVSYEVGC